MATDKTYFERVYKAPYKGWDTSAPENLIPPESSPFLETVYFYKNELKNFPVLLTSDILSPGAADATTGNRGWPIRAIIAARVLDTSSTSFGASTTRLKLGTFVLTDDGLYVLRAYWRNGYLFAGPVPWTVTDPIWQRLSTNRAYGIYGAGKFSWPIICSEGTLYYSANDNIKVTPPDFYTTSLYSFNYINGEQQIVLDATHQLGAKYLGVLDGHLILVNTAVVDLTTGLTTCETTRIRWSASGDFTQFDPNTNIGAGFADLSETPDEITGFMLMGRNALIFRTNGITEMFPLGGIAPFGFNHMWASDKGIGNILNGTIANYGSLGCFIAEDDIYAVSTANFKGISGTAKDQIYADLATRMDDSSVITTIIPLFKDGHVQLLYVVSIIQSDTSSIVWFYSITSELWMRRTFGPSPNLNSSQIFTAPAAVVPLGALVEPNPDTTVPASLIPPIQNKNRIAAFPTVSSTTGTNSIIKWFDPDGIGSFHMEYDYRVEDFEEGKQPTIHKIRIRYRDIYAGSVDFILILSGENVPDTNIPVHIVGLGDNKIKTFLSDTVFTAQAPQLKLTMDSFLAIGFKRLSIVSITLCGNLADGPEL